MTHPMTDDERLAWRISLFAPPNGADLLRLLWIIVHFADAVRETDPKQAERIYNTLSPRKGSLKEHIDEIDSIITTSLRDFKKRNDIE